MQATVNGIATSPQLASEVRDVATNQISMQLNLQELSVQMASLAGHVNGELTKIDQAWKSYQTLLNGQVEVAFKKARE